MTGVFVRGLVAAVAVGLVASCTAGPASTPPPSAPAATPTPAPTLADFAPGLREPASDLTAGLDEVPMAGDLVAVSIGEPTGTRWRDTNTGLSFEATDLADPRWEPGASSLDLLIGGLDDPSLRFGGNAVDRRMWWTSTDEPAPDWAEATVTPEDLARVGRFLAEVDATVTLVLPLGHLDPERAADFAAHAHQAWGERLVAIAFGNEPNGYHHPNQPELELRDAGYGPQQWLAEAERTQRAVEQVAPGLAVMGPGAYDATWWRAFGGSDLGHKSALTQHWYPLWSCADRTTGGDERFAPTVANMTAPRLHDKATAMFALARETAVAYDLPLYLDETGPTSCPGTNETSRTLAQGLWTVDYVFNGARSGVQRMNMHSALQACQGGPPMSVVCDRDKDAATPNLRGQSNYLGLLFAAQAREGEMRQVRVSGSADVFGYAIDHDDGTDLVLVNMGDPGTAAPLAINGLDAATVRASWLTGPRMGATEVSLTPLSATAGLPDRLPGGSAVLLRGVVGA